MHYKNLPHFNVIFIPDTVDYQAIALISLLLNSDLNFRLVGNSLNDNEAALLDQISQTSDRLEFVNFESSGIIPHGTLLDLLFLSETDETFCFCDSDLFLFEQLTQETLSTAIADASVLSSGGRIENQDDVVYAGFKGGATTISPDGLIDLATSFFCIYRREPLEKVLSKYGVGFEQYRLESQIPTPALDVVEKMSLEFDMFDTGKLTSVLLYELGYKKTYRELDGMVHIGGMSGRYLQQLDLSKETIEITEDELPEHESTRVDQFQLRNDYEKSLKRLYGKYFFCFLKYLISKGPKPILQASDHRITTTVTRLENELVAIVNGVDEDESCRQIWDLVKSS